MLSWEAALSKLFWCSSEKGSTFRVDPFSKGAGVQKSHQEVINAISLLKKTWQLYHVYLGAFNLS